MALCGPNLSLCCLLLSTWGLVQLFIMGFLFYFHSVAFVEDVAGLEESYDGNDEKFRHDISVSYSQTAYNCWIAACLYVVTLLISLQQFHSNSKKASSNF